MLSFTSPTDYENFFYNIGDFVIGPMDQLNAFAGARSWIRPKQEYLSERRGPYGENFCTHDKYEGSIEYLPIVAGTSPTNDVNFPCRVKLKARTTSGSRVELNVPYGVASSGGVARGRLNTQPIQYAFLRLPDGKWRVWRVQAAPGDPYSVNSYGYADYVGFQHVYGDMYNVQCLDYGCAYTLGVSGRKTDFDWRIQQDFYTITNLFPTSTNGRSTSAGYKNKYKIDTDFVIDVSNAQAIVDNALTSMMLDTDPTVMLDYGDLAMMASQKVNATNTNVIAFLRDLRHPEQLIPKLENFKRVKEYANGYLSVKYGILPTVDDLKSILGAFKNRAPFLDKNGFSCFNASHRDTAETVNTVFEVEQHCKIAVAKEDNGLIDLFNKLDSFGTFPNFEYIWDLVPYSFVIDWFTDVGLFLRRVDTNLRLLRLNVRYSTMSEKRTRRWNPSISASSPFRVSVDYSHYKRWVLDRPPRPKLLLPEFIPSFQSHWLEGASLFVQRL